jgi:SnoaL-like protein
MKGSGFGISSPALSAALVDKLISPPMPGDTTPEGAPDVVSRYFEADARRDIEAILSLFADDAVVVHAWRGRAEIRDWRLGPASKYEYTTTVARIDRIEDDHYRAGGRIDGNSPAPPQT